MKKIDVESVTPLRRSSEHEYVAVESCLEVFLNDARVAKLSCSPGMEQELAVGCLIADSQISGFHAVESCRIESDSCRVTTSDESGPVSSEDSPLQSATFATVLGAVDSLFQSQPTHGATGGTHATSLHETQSSWSVSVEDVSRTSALYKAIGAAVIGGVGLTTCIAATTGRLTSLPVGICASAGIPLLASRAVATDLGVETAREKGLTILGAVRERHAWLYNEGVCKVLLDIEG